MVQNTHLQAHHHQTHDQGRDELRPGVGEERVVRVGFHPAVHHGRHVDEEGREEFDHEVVHDGAPVIRGDPSF